MGQIRSYGVPLSLLIILVINFIRLCGKRYFEALEYYQLEWYTLIHGKLHHHRNNEDASNHP